MTSHVRAKAADPTRVHDAGLSAEGVRRNLGFLGLPIKALTGARISDSGPNRRGSGRAIVRELFANCDAGWKARLAMRRLARAPRECGKATRAAAGACPIPKTRPRHPCSRLHTTS